MSRRLGAKNKRTLAREKEQRWNAAFNEGRQKIIAAKGTLDTTVAVDSLSILEETMRHFYFKARILEGLGEVDAKALDQAWEQAGKWAKEVATFRHAKIAAIKLAVDPNDKALGGDLTLDQLTKGIMEDLARLVDSGVIDLTDLPGPSAIKRAN
jgi:hypothetical protein